jgi:hypothetical protein
MIATESRMNAGIRFEGSDNPLRRQAMRCHKAGNIHESAADSRHDRTNSCKPE